MPNYDFDSNDRSLLIEHLGEQLQYGGYSVERANEMRLLQDKLIRQNQAAANLPIDPPLVIEEKMCSECGQSLDGEGKGHAFPCAYAFCQQCRSHLDAYGFCIDETCPFHDRQQGET